MDIGGYHARGAAGGEHETADARPNPRSAPTCDGRESHRGRLVCDSGLEIVAISQWVKELGLCSTIDFSEIDKFDTSDTRDLRNMREHVVDYFRGCGNNQARWRIETPGYKTDASTMTGNMIGGRLDYNAFSDAAKRLLPHLLAEPPPNSPSFGLKKSR
jgi:hypothetical protein